MNRRRFWRGLLCKGSQEKIPISVAPDVNAKVLPEDADAKIGIVPIGVSISPETRDSMDIPTRMEATVANLFPGNERQHLRKSQAPVGVVKMDMSYWRTDSKFCRNAIVPSFQFMMPKEVRVC